MPNKYHNLVDQLNMKGLYCSNSRFVGIMCFVRPPSDQTFSTINY